MSARRGRDEQSGRFLRFRMGLELVKAGIWTVFQWMRSGGSFGPWL
ncbi:hypothetical protein ACSNOI_03270 [Actinomadura kijaniata]